MRFLTIVFTLLTMMCSSALAFDNVAEAKAYIEKHKGDVMKDGYSLPITNCAEADEACITEYAHMLLDLKNAYKKDYQAQRNIGYCLWSGCDGQVQKNATLGCAWVVVLLASGSPKVNELDTKNLKQCIATAGTENLGVIKSQAAALFQTIYKREIPADWQ